MSRTTATKPTAKTPEATIVEIEKGLAPLEKEARNVVIQNEDDMKNAASFLAKVKAYSNRITELQEFFTDPYVEQRRVALEQKKKVEDMFAPKLQPLLEIERKVKRAIADYSLEQERKARAEEERLRKIREQANEKRAEKGQGEILTPVKTVERVAPTVRTEEGRTMTKKTWKFEITDTTTLLANRPFAHELLLACVNKGLHEQLVRTMVKNGIRELPGVRIYEDIEVAVMAN